MLELKLRKTAENFLGKRVPKSRRLRYNLKIFARP